MPRILVVEDEAPIRYLLADALADEGYAVATAEHGAAALDQARAQPPDAVVLDLMMPIMDGWTFLRARQGDPTLAGVPVVVLSAAGERGLQQAKELGADAYLAKPFDLDALLLLVGQLATGERGNG